MSSFTKKLKPTTAYDEKLEVSSGSSSEGIDPEVSLDLEEKRLVRKLDRRILPIACLLYLFACVWAEIMFPTILSDTA